jgi:hypothetical protein
VGQFQPQLFQQNQAQGLVLPELTQHQPLPRLIGMAPEILQTPIAIGLALDGGGFLGGKQDAVEDILHFILAEGQVFSPEVGLDLKMRQ